MFEIDSVLDDFSSFFDHGTGSGAPLERIREGLSDLSRVEKSFIDLLNIVIHTIFAYPSNKAGGGSTSALIGCIWVDLRPHWTIQDVQEFLIHETAHNLMFLDELSRDHYVDYGALSNPVNFTDSAILARPRPLDKVLHSIVVATEVLLFREEHLGHPQSPCLHPPTDILISQTETAIRSLIESKQAYKLLTQRGCQLIEISRNAIAQLAHGVEI